MKENKIFKRNLFFLILPLIILLLGVGLVSWAVVNYLPPADYVYVPLQSAKVVIAKKSLGVAKFPAKTKPKLIAYPETIHAGETIGSLYISAINRSLRIVQGTDEEALKLGVGHFIDSVLPGIKDNCVLSGHRDGVFERLGELKKGDKLIINTVTGKHAYVVASIRIVDADNRTVIVPTKNAVLTLTTCYPFQYFGHAPKRYIVTAKYEGSKFILA